MTNSTSISRNSEDEWHVVNVIPRVEWRQISLDTYELRSPRYEMMVNKEGFEIFIENLHVDNGAFERWCEDKNVRLRPRKDIK